MMEYTKTAAPTAIIVLRSIADDKSMALFRAIAQSKKEADSESLKKETKLTRKQYYVRLARMVKSGLVKKKRERYALTTLGKIVYYSQIKVDDAWINLWKTKTIDSLEMQSDKLSKEERQRFADNVFDAGEA